MLILLMQVLRQIGDAQKQFRETLERLATGELVQLDYDLLKTRFAVNNVATAHEFTDAIRIMAKKEDIKTFNQHKLRALNTPVALIKAIGNNVTSEQATDDDAQGLQAILHLAVGCRVILRQNLWTTQGLCNGTLGTVSDIVYKPGGSPNYMDDMPPCVMVKFDGYTGPTYYDSLPLN